MANQSTEGTFSPLLKRWRIGIVQPLIYGRVLDFGCGDGELAKYVGPTKYCGLDQDEQTINIARQLHPDHFFINSISQIQGLFDTLVLSAVVEHLAEPHQTISFLATFLKKDIQSKIIITTPHPRAEWVHNLGASLGLFSKHAAEENNILFTEETLIQLTPAGLKMSLYKTFQFGFNQLAIYKYA